MNILVTGSSGYIGTRLTSQALQDGHHITLTSRSISEGLSRSCLLFNLSLPDPIVIPNQIEVIIHLAANTNFPSPTDAKIEIESTVNLLNASLAIGAKFIFVSSQTASQNSLTTYGKTKWCIEQKVLLAGGFVVRPGQVYGGELRGLFGLIAKYIKYSFVLPAFIPSPMVQPIHVDDLITGLLSIANRNDIESKIYYLATPQPISFLIFIKTIAELRLRCRRFFVPIPTILITFFQIFFGGMINVMNWHHRLRSLFNLPIMDTARDLDLLNLVLRPLRSGMHRSGRVERRCLLLEGNLFLEYILKSSPPNEILRRYVRAIEHLRDGHPLGLPKFLLHRPILLSAMTRQMWSDKTKYAEYIWRLDSATIIAEASTLGAKRFISSFAANSKYINILFMTIASGSAFFWLLIGIIATPGCRLIFDFNKTLNEN